MNNYSKEQKKFEAEQRRKERTEARIQKELGKLQKTQEKLSAIEQARLEVRAHEIELDLLLSVHKESRDAVDWIGLASTLPPHRPSRLPRNELAALLNDIVSSDEVLAKALMLDQREHEAAIESYEKKLEQWGRFRALAQKILTGETSIYPEAITEFSELEGKANIGSAINMTIHGPKLIECVLNVNGVDIIPSEVKSLTAAGKLSVKSMSKGKFHEIYQDYVCGCVLRVAREMLAVLPVDTVLVTATVNRVESSTGVETEFPVLSICAPRLLVERLSFENLDPSDALDNFLHRGDVKVSRKSGEFLPIVPLAPEDLPSAHFDSRKLTDFVSYIREFRGEIGAIMDKMKPETSEQQISERPVK